MATPQKLDLLEQSSRCHPRQTVVGSTKLSQSRDEEGRRGTSLMRIPHGTGSTVVVYEEQNDPFQYALRIFSIWPKIPRFSALPRWRLCWVVPRRTSARRFAEK